MLLIAVAILAVGGVSGKMTSPNCDLRQRDFKGTYETEHNSSQYVFVLHEKNMEDANTFCKCMNGTLTNVDKNVQLFLEKCITALDDLGYTDTDKYWIEFTAHKKGILKSITGLFSSTEDKQYSNFKKISIIGDCVAIDKNDGFLWDKMRCSQTAASICRIDSRYLSTPNPTATTGLATTGSTWDGNEVTASSVSLEFQVTKTSDVHEHSNHTSSHVDAIGCKCEDGVALKDNPMVIALVVILIISTVLNFGQLFYIIFWLRSSRKRTERKTSEEFILMQDLTSPGSCKSNTLKKFSLLDVVLESDTCAPDKHHSQSVSGPKRPGHAPSEEGGVYTEAGEVYTCTDRNRISEEIDRDDIYSEAMETTSNIYEESCFLGSTTVHPDKQMDGANHKLSICRGLNEVNCESNDATKIDYIYSDPEPTGKTGLLAVPCLEGFVDSPSIPNEQRGGTESEEYDVNENMGYDTQHTASANSVESNVYGINSAVTNPAIDQIEYERPIPKPNRDNKPSETRTAPCRRNSVGDLIPGENEGCVQDTIKEPCFEEEITHTCCGADAREHNNNDIISEYSSTRDANDQSKTERATTSSDHNVYGINSATTSSDHNVYGINSATTSSDHNVYGINSATTSSDHNVYGINSATTSSDHNVYGINSATTSSDHNVYGINSATTNSDHNVYGINSATTSSDHNVYGINSATTSSDHNVYGINSATTSSDHNVYGINSATTSSDHNVYGINSATTNSDHNVYGINSATTSSDHNVYGINSATTSSDHNVYGINSATTSSDHNVYGINSATTSSDHNVYGINSATTNSDHNVYGINSATTSSDHNVYGINSATNSSEHNVYGINSATTCTIPWICATTEVNHENQIPKEDADNVQDITITQENKLRECHEPGQEQRL